MITWSPENAVMSKIQDALIRAAKTAREDARRHGVPIVVWKDGQVVLEDPGGGQPARSEASRDEALITRN